MRAYRDIVYALVAFSLAVPVWAQEKQTVEVTPYVALGTQAAPRIGAAVTFPLTSKFSLETDVAYRRGEGGIHALSSNASLLWLMPRLGQATPYAAGGIGLAQYGAPVFSAGGSPIGTASHVAITANAGGGLMMPMTDHLDLRTDGRWIKSFGREGSEQFRLAQGISFDLRRR